MTRPLGAAAGILLDRALGEPPPDWPHPVAQFGSTMLALENRLWRDGRPAGVVHAAIGLGVGALAGAAARSTAASTYVAVAGRLLHDTALGIAAALDAGDLDAARARLPALAGRNPSGLDQPAIVRAVVESVAENTVDAIVAPALWAAALGGAGALGYRAVNTMDSMVGHRSPRYLRFGWAAARLDDAAGWVPARATAVLVAMVRPSSAGAVWRTVRRDAPAHPSPNAGVAEAAFAAALGLRLGGTNTYGERVEHRPPLGEGRPPEPADVHHAVRLSRDVTLALAAVLAAVGTARQKTPLSRSARNLTSEASGDSALDVREGGRRRRWAESSSATGGRTLTTSPGGCTGSWPTTSVPSRSSATSTPSSSGPTSGSGSTASWGSATPSSRSSVTTG